MTDANADDVKNPDARAKAGSGTLGRRPLYAQVKELMVDQMIAGRWQPGDMLPNEMALAAEFEVSQGTVRKALNEMESQNLVMRKQGRGTFVSQHTPQRSLFHFFHVVEDGGTSELPTSMVISQRARRARKEEARYLQLESAAGVHAITRVRYLAGEAVVVERIILPAELFPGLALRVGETMKEELYVLYQQTFRVTILRARDELKAIGADELDAEHLDVEPGAPLLEIRRVALDISGRPAELRISHADTRHHAYVSELD